MDNNLRQRVAVLIDPVFETDENRVQVATIRELLAEAESTSARVAELEQQLADRDRVIEAVRGWAEDDDHDQLTLDAILTGDETTIRALLPTPPRRKGEAMTSEISIREARGICEDEQQLEIEEALSIITSAEALRARVAELEAELDEARDVIEAVRGISEPWPLDSVLDTLADAATLLLDDHDYDGEGHENIRCAVQRADEIRRALLPTPPKGDDDDK